MKQKYLILKNDEKNELIIKEFLEINKEMFSLVCEETYDNNDIESAIAKDKKHLVSVLRTNNMYPVWLYADKLAESIITMYGTEHKEPIKLLFDDAESFSKTQEKVVALEVVDEDKVPEDDELLEDDFDSHKILKNNCTIIVADDEPDDDEVDHEEEI